MVVKDNVSGLLLHLNFFLWFDNLIIPYLFSLIVLILSILGLFPRFLCMFQSWVTYSFFYSLLVVESGDQINAILTFLIIPICILDKRRNGWKTQESNISTNNILYINASIAILFISVQMAILYLNAGISKYFLKNGQMAQLCTIGSLIICLVHLIGYKI